MNFENFKDCLYKHTKNYQTVTSLNSKKHDMFVIEQNKLSLNNFDGKRFICENGIDTLPFGY